MRNIMSIEVCRIRTKKSKSNMIFTIRKIKNQKKWTREEDELLISLAEQYNEKHWKEISKRFVKKNSLQCFSRYKRIRPGIVKGSWKKEEDLRIIDLVNKYGKSWSKISKILGTRNGKQIRDRFINVLDPEIRKGKFTEEEDSKLVALFKQYGPKWATIAKYYPNRTADMIKNRFHSSIKKKLTSDSIDKDSFLYKDTDMTFANKYTEENFNSNTTAGNAIIPQNSMMIDPKHQQYVLGPTDSQQNLTTFNGSKSNSQLDSPRDNVCHQDLESYDNSKNMSSNYCNREIDLDFIPYNYNANNCIFDMLNNDNAIKSDEGYEGGNLIWNFEDYFTI